LNLAAWRSFARLLQGTRRLIALSLVIAVGQTLLLIPIAFLVRRAFDVTIPAGDTSQLILMGAGILGLFMASLALGVLTRRLALQATRDSIARLREELTEKILLAPRAYFDRADLGTLHATIVQDTERLEVMTIALVSVLMPGAVVSFGLVATLFVIAPVLAALLLVVVPAVFIVGRMLNRRVRQGTRRWKRAYDAFSSQTHLALRSATLIRLHGAERSELERRRQQIDELGEKRLAMLWAQNLYSQITAIITAAAGVVVLVVGGVLVSDGSLSLGDLISFYAVLGLLRTQLLSGGLAVPGAAGDHPGGGGQPAIHGDRGGRLRRLGRSAWRRLRVRLGSPGPPRGPSGDRAGRIRRAPRSERRWEEHDHQPDRRALRAPEGRRSD